MMEFDVCGRPLRKPGHVLYTYCDEAQFTQVSKVTQVECDKLHHIDTTREKS